MTNIPPDPKHLKALWRDQQNEETQPLTLEIIHARSFQSRVGRRNLVEYIACVFVIVTFGSYIVILPPPILKLASALVILGTLIVAWQLHRRGSARMAPTIDALAFHRAEMVRQRDALRSVWLWYLGPFVPGTLLFMVGMSTLLPAARLAYHMVLPVATVAIFAFCWWINMRAARRLQREIDDLDRLKRD